MSCRFNIRDISINIVVAGVCVCVSHVVLGVVGKAAVLSSILSITLLKSPPIKRTGVGSLVIHSVISFISFIAAA